jgi:hypothetical protein
MPHAATRLTQVTVGDPDELVAPGLQQHALEQSPVCGFVVGAERDLRTCAAQLLGQFVSKLLELAEAEQARATGRRFDAHVDNGPRKRGGERVREVTVEPGDLHAQRAARRKLTRPVDEREPTKGQSLRAFVERNHAVRSS